MKKNYFFKSLMLLIPGMAIVLMANSAGKTGSFSGSPGDSGNNCTSCHGGGSFGASVSVTTNIPVTGYELNTNYTITVNNNSTATRHGFQLTAEKNTDNTKVGSFTASGDVQVVNSGTHVTHTNPNQNSWQFTWTSPATDQGRVTFYVASVAANGNGSFTGDQVVTGDSGSISSLSIEGQELLTFSMYPNPSTDFLTVQLPSGTETADVGVYDYTGRLMVNQKVTQQSKTIDVKDLSRGLYVVKVNSASKIAAKQFIKN